MSSTRQKEIKFESALVRLEEIVDKLESGNIELDDSIKLFEEGMQLVKFCSTKLDEVKRKVEILVKKGDGKLEKTKFTDDDDDEEKTETVQSGADTEKKGKQTTDELF